MLEQRLTQPVRVRDAEPQQGLPRGPGQGAVGRPGAGRGRLGQHPGPALRALGEHGDRRPDVGAALGVVGGQHGPGQRPVALQAGAVRVEVAGGEAGRARVAADLVGRQQRHVPVERRVLHRLGAQRGGGLREPGAELLVPGPVPGPPQRQVPHDAHRVRLLRHPEGGTGLGGGLLGEDRLGVGGVVGPVDLHADQQLAQRGAQRPGGVVAQRGVRRAGADVRGHPGEPVHLGGQLVVDGLVRRPARGGRPVAPGVRLRGGEGAVVGEQFPGALRVGEDAVDAAQGVVAGGAVHRPGGGQHLPVGEDLLHDGPPAAGRLVQLPQIRVGVGEAVRVVHAQTVEHALVEQPQDRPVRGPEDLRVLHADADEVRDAEEPPVVQLRAGQPPPGGAVPLGVDQPRQRQPGGALAEREDVVVVAQDVAVDGEVVDLGAERVAEDGEQELSALRLPVDVEPACVRRLRALAQDLPQRAVVARGHRHVVGDDVHDQAEAVLACRRGQRAQGRLAAEFLPDAGVVDDVVAVEGAGRGLQDGGEVEVGDAERGEVGDGCLGCGERETGLQLQAVGGRGRR